MAQFDYSMIEGPDFSWMGKLGEAASSIALPIVRKKALTAAGGDYTKAAEILKNKGDIEGSQAYQQLGDKETAKQTKLSAQAGMQDLLSRFQQGKVETPSSYTPGTPIVNQIPMKNAGETVTPDMPKKSLASGVEGPEPMSENIPSPIVSRSPMSNPGGHTDEIVSPYSEAEMANEILTNPKITANMSPQDLMALMLKNRELKGTEDEKAAATKASIEKARLEAAKLSEAEKKSAHLEDALGRLRNKYANNPEFKNAFESDPQNGGSVMRNIISKDPEFAKDQEVLLDWTNNAFKRDIPTTADLWQMTLSKDDMQAKRQAQQVSNTGWQHSLEKIDEGGNGVSGFVGAHIAANNIISRMSRPQAGLGDFAESAKELMKITDNSMITQPELKQFFDQVNITIPEQVQAFIMKNWNGQIPDRVKDYMIKEAKLKMTEKTNMRNSILKTKPKDLPYNDPFVQQSSHWVPIEINSIEETNNFPKGTRFSLGGRIGTVK